MTTDENAPGAPMGEPLSDLPPVDRPSVSITEAAALCGVSRDIIRRRLRAGSFPGAWRDPGRPGDPWLIPVTDLGGAGLRPGAPTPGEPEAAPRAPDEVGQLRERLARVEGERDTWRARAEERASALDIATLALRALPAAPETPASAPERRRGWFSR